MKLIEQIKDSAIRNRQRIVLPESHEERTLRAADVVIKDGLADVILIGNREKVLTDAGEKGLTYVDQACFVDPLNNPKAESYAEMMVELRKSKGLTKDQAMEQLKDPLYLGAVMIKYGDADGEVAGADNATGDVLRPAFQYVKTAPGISIVSGAFLMFLQDTEYGEGGLMLFADCAVNPDPCDSELAAIAISTAQTARSIAKMEPRIAMLSFSTKGSASHALVDKVVRATVMAKSMEPDLKIDGELQADAAIVASVGKKKAPGSDIAGTANVLIFPDLESGNIAYKLVQRLGHAEAVGPILQGLASPINDLSRGCSVNDIVDLVAITANQAIGLKKR